MKIICAEDIQVVLDQSFGANSDDSAEKSAMAGLGSIVSDKFIKRGSDKNQEI